MRHRQLFIGLASALTILLCLSTARAQESAALTGRVASTAEGPMEGVVVSASRPDSTVTISVVTDAQGRYSFPAAKLTPGHYALAIRADGWDLDGNGAAQIVAGTAAVADLTLRKTHNLAAQLNDAEWMASVPGSDAQRKFLLNCNECHSLQRIVSSTHTADEFLQVFQRMAGWCPCSTPLRPQKLAVARHMPPLPVQKAAADYLASINLSTAPTWSYPLKVLPRTTGRANRVIITEYALPRATIEPHDVIVDHDGIVWFSEFGDNFLGRLDPKTGAVTEYPVPRLKADAPPGALDLEFGPNDTLWLGLQFQAGIAVFDKKTRQFTMHPLPAAWQTGASQVGFVTPTASSVDNKVWLKNVSPNLFFRLDLANGNLENIGTPRDPATEKPLGAYGIPADSHNNVYLLDIGSDIVSRIDAKTLAISVFHTPTPLSRPRRGRFDGADHLWFAEYGANAIARFDPATSQFREWTMPTPWTNPYDVAVDRNGDAWTASMFADRVERLDPKTGEIDDFPLPERTTNIRHVFVDNSTNPVSFWAGSNHNAGILKLEPLE